MIEISLAVIALAFVILVIYLIIVLRSTNALLNQLPKTLFAVQNRINELSAESMKLMQNTRDITTDVKEKLDTFDPLFQAISLVGDVALSTTQSFKERAEEVKEEIKNDPIINATFTQKETSKQEKLDQVMEWVALGVNVWKILKRRK